jgi:hypothetical protein
LDFLIHERGGRGGKERERELEKESRKRNCLSACLPNNPDLNNRVY